MTSTLRPEACSDGSGQLFAIHCIAGSARGDDADRGGVRFAGHGCVISDGPGCGGNRVGLQAMRLIEAVAEASLLALLADGLDRVAGHIGYQQFHGVGADINNSAADGLHTTSYQVRAPRKQAGGVLQGFLA